MTTASAAPIDWRKEVTAGLEEMRAFSRRGFFTLVGLVGLAVATLAATVLSLRFVIPNVTYDESLLFKAGAPDDYPVGSTTIFSDKRIALNRDVDGFYAVSLICTHLGCTPRWFQQDSMFRCPCHGSRYLRDGVRFFGPAPRPMDVVKVGVSPDGQLFVDRGKIVARTERQAV
ncbi:MAG: ubiquinol-cytochrome c reductase iron-sulfur subunit [Candidatus Dormibacteraeota bacterium]|nr:ubiquinol-cytochrome c reductase iron-sulfur subunit [Candidatus Dormibacteraeota bacterium]